jgi:hypothetical protein
MKNPFFTLFIFVLLVGSFLGGAWYSQHGTAQNSGKERRILHYVDPMNPVNVSDKPGIAPCGMPMEPVYGDEKAAGVSPSGAALSMSPGTVTITPQNQQIIGVKIGAAERMSGTYEIRTLGRVTPDENRVYPLIAATDGWVGAIQGNTTGSPVKKDQLLAQIKIYNYDFFTWQQRYLTEFTNLNSGERGYPASLAPRQPAPLPPAQSNAMQAGVGHQHETPEAAVPSEPPSADMPVSDMSESRVPPSRASRPRPQPQPQPQAQAQPHPQTWQNKDRLPATISGLPGQLLTGPQDNRPDVALYAVKSRLELLNLGVREAQLQELVKTNQYVPTIELRSPVNGLVISRSISSNQRVDRGTECFRVADLGRVWIIAEVFNAEAPYIRPGMTARISLPGQSKKFEVMVSDVLPTLDATARSQKVRLEMDNPKNLLLPEMIVDVEFPIILPAAVTVPASAILDSGRKKTVFVSLGDGIFEPRHVVTGWRFGDRVEIVGGLMPGEQIVTSGNFLIDSESRMKLAAAGLSKAPENEPPEKTPPRFTKKPPEATAGKSAPSPVEHKHD